MNNVHSISAKDDPLFEQILTALYKKRCSIIRAYDKDPVLVVTMPRESLRDLLSDGRCLHHMSAAELSGYGERSIAGADILIVPDQKAPFRILISSIGAD